MLTMYMAAIAGLPVGLFHDPGPTLAAQYPNREYADLLTEAVIKKYKKHLYADWIGFADETEEEFGAFLEVLKAHERVDRKAPPA